VHLAITASTSSTRALNALAALLDELRTVPDFVERWSMSATEKRRGTRRIVHPGLGRLQLNYEVLLPADDVDE
jgi:hypothetical protein